MRTRDGLSRRALLASMVWMFMAGIGLALGAASQTQSANTAPKGLAETRRQAYTKELEDYLRRYLVDDYPQRAGKAWARDYRSIEAFLASVEPNRQRWRKLLNPPDLQRTGPLQKRLHEPLADVQGQWLTLPLGPIQADAVLVMPPSTAGPVPLVVVQHGIASLPDRVFGVGDEGKLYHDYGRELVNAGFAVLAPLNLSPAESRNRIDRLCRLADTTLPGIELVRLQRLLDAVLTDSRIAGDRVGMWGISLGGMATMFWMPLEPRIKVGVVSAWFNDRRNKMAVPDTRYSCFLDVNEEHAFLRGWLTEFTDYDVVSLICPRPLLIQTGKKDPISWWPMVIEELNVARQHYERLGLTGRVEMDLHDGGHEIRVESGVRFLTRWLKNSAP